MIAVISASYPFKNDPEARIRDGNGQDLKDKKE